MNFLPPVAGIPGRHGANSKAAFKAAGDSPQSRAERWTRQTGQTPTHPPATCRTSWVAAQLACRARVTAVPCPAPPRRAQTTDGFSGLNGGWDTPGTGMNFLVHNMVGPQPAAPLLACQPSTPSTTHGPESAAHVLAATAGDKSARPCGLEVCCCHPACPLVSRRAGPSRSPPSRLCLPAAVPAAWCRRHVDGGCGRHGHGHAAPCSGREAGRSRHPHGLQGQQVGGGVCIHLAALAHTCQRDSQSPCRRVSAASQSVLQRTSATGQAARPAWRCATRRSCQRFAVCMPLPQQPPPLLSCHQHAFFLSRLQHRCGGRGRPRGGHIGWTGAAGQGGGGECRPVSPAAAGGRRQLHPRAEREAGWHAEGWHHHEGGQGRGRGPRRAGC